MSEIITTYSDMVYTFNSSVALEHYKKLCEEYKINYSWKNVPNIDQIGVEGKKKIPIKELKQKNGVLINGELLTYTEVYTTKNSKCRKIISSLLGSAYSSIELIHHNYEFYCDFPDVYTKTKTYYTIGPEPEILKSKIETENTDKVWNQKRIHISRALVQFEGKLNLSRLHTQLNNPEICKKNFYWQAPIDRSDRYFKPSRPFLTILPMDGRNKYLNGQEDLGEISVNTGIFTGSKLGLKLIPDPENREKSFLLTLKNSMSQKPLVGTEISDQIDIFLSDVISNLEK